MKRKDLMKRLAQIAKAEGVELRVKEGANHTLVSIGDRRQPVPRHGEIAEMLARSIIKRMEGDS